MNEGSSAAELYEALDRIAPELEAMSRQAEIDRRPSEAMASLMKGARLPMAKVPRDVGGFEIPPSEQVDYFARIAYLNPTAGWLAFVHNGAAGLAAATLDEGGLARVFENDSPLFAAVSAPTGNSTSVDGGYRVSGRWSYASGVHVAEWIILVSICDEPAGVRGVVLPRKDIEIHDNWNVMALQGTGSADVVVDDVFVPTEMTLDPLVQRRGGSQYVNIGYRGYVGGENVGFSLGVAQRMVDEITILARTKKRVMDPDAVGDRGAFQLELGRVDASLRAARVYAIDELARATAVAEDSGEQLKPHGMARVEAAVGWATECICQAANRLFPFAGAGALHLDNPIQRTYRDLLGSGQHVVASNETMEKWGQSLMAASAEI